MSNPVLKSMLVKDTTGNPVTADIINDSYIGEAAWSGKNIVDKLCPSFTESGEVVSFEPLEGTSLKVISNIKFTQEGSGNPHPGGSLIDIGDSWKDNVNWTKEDSVYHLAPHCYYYNPNLRLEPGQYTVVLINGSYREGVLVWLEIETSPNTWETVQIHNPDGYPNGVPTNITAGFTLEVSRSIRLAVHTENQLPDSVNIYEDVLKKIALYSGSAPNIRPIVAHAAVNLSHSGKNLLSEDWKIFENYNSNKRLILNLPKGKYTLSAEKTNVTYLYLQNSTDGNNTWSNYHHLHTNNTPTIASCTFEVTGEPGEEWALWTASQGYLDYLKWVQIEADTVATAFEPYRGENFTIELGQSVYGGSYNWTTGELTIGWKKVVFNGTEAWAFYNSTSTITSGYSCNFVDKAIGYNTSVCNQFKNTLNSDAFAGSKMQHGLYTDHNSYSRVYFDWGKKYENAESTTAVAAFKAWLKQQYDAGTPVELCYQLAAPIITQFAPQEIIALQGVNALFSNTGSTTVNSKVYPDVVIEKLTNAIIALGGNV